MEEAVNERGKVFVAVHRSDEDRQAYIFASQHASSVIAKAKDKRLALLSHLNLTLNLFTLSFVLSLALFPHLPPLLTSPTVLFPWSRLRSSLIT